MKILACLLPAIINDDVSGLTELEFKQVQAFVDSFPACIFNTDTIEPFFSNCELTGLAGDCVVLSITRPHFKTRYINSRRGAAIETLEALNNLNYTNKGFDAAIRKACIRHQDKGRALNDECHYYVSNRSTKEWRAK